MRKRLILAAVAVMAVTFVIEARAPQGADPDKKVKGSGLPPGWQARLDYASARIDDLKFAAAGAGFRATTGPAGIFYQASRTFSGPMSVSATFTQVKPSDHPEAYGLFIGGSDLQGPNQKYTYFLIRQDGWFLVKRRAGGSTPTLINWTDHAAIRRADASGKMTNALAISVDQQKARFLVNTTEVASLPLSQVDSAGIAGLRVNHNLDVQIDGLAFKPDSATGR